MKNITFQVWDLPLRLFHWLLVACTIAAYVTSELDGRWLDWHIHIGVFTLSLVIFRIAWGFMGTRYSQFKSFRPSYTQLKNYLTSNWSGAGHSPLGALSVYALLGLILFQSGFGLFAFNDEIDLHAPLYKLANSAWVETLTDWHLILFDTLLAFIALHLAAIGYYTLIKRKNIIAPMITGYITVNTNVNNNSASGGSTVKLITSITLAALFFGIIESGLLSVWLSGPPNAGSYSGQGW